MSTLLIPAAGRSTRYGLDRPKFLLQHPMGGTMLEACISGFGKLSNSQVDRIMVLSLAEYFEDISMELIRNRIANQHGIDVEFLLLDAPTSSMVETICIGLSAFDLDGPFIVKDSDNYLELDLELLKKNSLASVNLNRFNIVSAQGKSFLKVSDHSGLIDILEKKISSEIISVGCVRFESASDFLAASKQVGIKSEPFVSDVIKVMISSGIKFDVVEASNYEDWGTLTDWLNYCGTFKTLFLDLDGIVFHNENPNSLSGGWDKGTPIKENVKYLLNLQDLGRTKMIFTTSRSEEFRDSVAFLLNETGFIHYSLLMGLPHCQRVLVNDFARTNPYPSAVAISIPRDSINLSSYLK